MTTPHERDLERLLDKDGGEFSALYRRLSRAEPPRRIDRSVIAEAARAVHGYAPRRQRWLVGAGSAAGLVLAAGIAWHVGQDARLRQQTESAAAQRVVPVQAISEPTPRKEERATQVPPMTDTAPEQPAAVRRTAAKPLPPPAPAAASPTPFPAQSVRSAEKSAHAAPPAEPESTAKSTRAEGMSSPTAAAERTQLTAPATQSHRVERHLDAQSRPDDWLAHIRQLLRQGHRQQALESLRQFQRAHPERPLPDDLHALGD